MVLILCVFLEWSTSENMQVPPFVHLSWLSYLPFNARLRTVSDLGLVLCTSWELNLEIAQVPLYYYKYLPK